ncbi:MAG: hypothetical protein AAB343_03400 [Patescibacteria group bacterium]
MTFITVFFVALTLNLLWEFWHWRYYETCLRMLPVERQLLLATMSVKDAVWITIFYGIATSGLFLHGWKLVLAVAVMGLMFSYTDERVSLYLKRWEYAVNMPRVLGVGLWPLLELAVTGAISTFITVILF